MDYPIIDLEDNFYIEETGEFCVAPNGGLFRHCKIKFPDYLCEFFEVVTEVSEHPFTPGLIIM